jgi:hypothetical protein
MAKVELYEVGEYVTTERKIAPECSADVASHALM